jgi:hypothetical protein
MAKEEIGLSIKLDAAEAVKSVGNLKRELKEAERDAIAIGQHFGEGSSQAVAAAKNVAKLRDTIGDAKALMDAFNPDRKFQAFSTAVRGAANGFTALQGAMGLFGAESEDVQKTLVKVQAALAFSEGLNGLLEFGDGFKNLKAVAVDAFKGIKGAMIATGIGALVVAVATLYAYWDDIKSAVFGVGDAQKKLNEASQKNLETQQSKLDAIGEQENILKLQGKSERDILKLKIAATDEAIKAATVNLENAENTKNAQVAAAKRNREITLGILNALSMPIRVVLSTIDKIAGFIGQKTNLAKGLDDMNKSFAKSMFDENAVSDESEKTVEAARKALTKMQNDRAGFHLAIQSIDKEAHKKKLDLLEKQHEEERKKRDELNKLKTKFDQEMQGMDTEAIEGPQEQAKAEDKSSDVLDDENMKKRIALLSELTLSEKEIKLRALESEYAEKLLIIRGSEEAELALKKWYAGQKEQIEQAEREAKLATFDAVAGAIGAMGSLFKKESAAAKIAALAEIAIGTGTGFIRALEIAQKSAKATGPGAAFAFPIFYASQIAAVLGAAGRAKAILSSGSSGGGSGSVSAPTMTMPTAPLSPEARQTSLDQNSINQIGNAASAGIGRNYILDADIRNAQQREQRIRRAATLG